MTATALAGFSNGQSVQEIGWDDDVDEQLRTSIESTTGSELLDEDTDEVVDVVILWFRDEDGDLTDALVDSITSLTDQGVVWLFTPKAGRDGHVDSEDIAEAAPIAGLQQTSTVNAAPDWQGTRLVTPKASRGR